MISIFIKTSCKYYEDTPQEFQNGQFRIMELIFLVFRKNVFQNFTNLIQKGIPCYYNSQNTLLLAIIR